MLAMDDLAVAVEGRAAERLARRLVPAYPGDLPPFLPEAWLALLRDPSG